MQEKATMKKNSASKRVGDRVARYYGEVMNAIQARESNNQYIIQISKDTFLDGEKYEETKGRYINDGGAAGRENNARISKTRKLNICDETGRAWISIFATKTILPGEEVLMPYDRGWKWDWMNDAPAKATQNTVPQMRIVNATRLVQQPKV